jgi:ATP-dependent Clp protease ATP-binding subunit ClpA
MNYYQIKDQKKEIYPALLLDLCISFEKRNTIRKILFWLTLIFLFSSFIPSSAIENFLYVIRAGFFFFLSVYILFYLFEAMYRSYYFLKTRVDFRVLKILEHKIANKDITQAFLADPLGMYVMNRLGFSTEAIQNFIKTKKDFVTKKEFEIIENDDNTVSFTEFAYSLIHFDSDLAQLCKEKGITHLDFKQTLMWCSDIDYSIKDRQRWWLRDNLLRLPSIGAGLSFGQIYYLEKLGHNMNQDTAYIQLGEKHRVYKDMLVELETILSKTHGGNVILTARENYVTKDALASLTYLIEQGRVLPTLEHKRVYILETTLLISNYDEPSQFEIIFQNVLKQAADAGNIILVLNDFAQFIEHADRIGINIKPIIKDALESSELHIIATSNERAFHEHIETDLDLMYYFEKISLPETDLYQTISIIKDQILYLENQNKIFFTFQAIKRIVESADRYFAELSLLDKSLDILEEVVFFAKQNKKLFITPDVIDILISQKTGISVGKVTKKEAEKMRNIKELMSQKIIGQEQAVDAVCDAMIRARSGITNSKRPLASFLFVGPTGVGKTETAKVLTDLFFGNQDQMLRSDMSEYSGPDGLEKIIGFGNTIGVFASKVRETGSGVLLLDEFEKASTEVHDLFLQIIDEGFFTDARGERIMMRNFIIIATSNAGSALWSNGNHLEKQTLIQHIIDNRIFKAELLNRFDEIVLFNNLNKDNLSHIIHLAISGLSQRLDSKGITFKETPQLIEYLTNMSLNSTFGAREVNRVIKKELESKIARALVLGDLFEGDTISFILVNNQLEIQKYT